MSNLGNLGNLANLLRSGNLGNLGNIANVTVTWGFPSRVRFPFIREPDLQEHHNDPVVLGFPDQNWGAEFYAWLILAEFVKTDWDCIKLDDPEKDTSDIPRQIKLLKSTRSEIARTPCRKLWSIRRIPDLFHDSACGVTAIPSRPA